jgi:transketolase
MFGNEFPDRYFDMGISEQDMMGTAAGLATCGKIPFAATFAVFAAMRACEQVRTSICYPKLNVKVVATHSGLSAGPTGPTHQGTEDMAIMRSFPNMTVLSPADAPTVRAAVRAMAAHDGPVYMRLPRSPLPILHAESFNFEIGRAITVRDGKDATIIGTGVMVARALQAAAVLDAEGICLRVVDMHTIKPLDEETVIRSARETGRIVTLEDHNIIGGLGGAVAEAVTKLVPVRVLRMGVPDCFGWVGSHDELLDQAGLSVAEIVLRVREFCGK